jgi:lipopolysaccharide export system permease protein
MKKIDKLLLSSFFGPFAVSFGIALFVLVMQFLWLYIDDIAGKGVNLFVLLELIAYLSISMFPMALPIAMLIASVMVLGNLAEHYELSSMKSAGISLLRVMRSLIVCAAGIALFSYLISDFVIPVANLQFKSRLYDIRKQKPALAIEQGVFNEDFRQFVIRVGQKERDGETIRQVLIDDQSSAGRTKMNQILADSGQMYTTRNNRYFVMNLFRGTQYQEPTSSGAQEQGKYPFIRTNFKSWTKVWDMGEFEMGSTDKDRFKAGRSQLTMKQLRFNVDSLNDLIWNGKKALAEDLMANLKKQLAPAPVPSAVVPPQVPPDIQNPPPVEQKSGKAKNKIRKKKSEPIDIKPAQQIQLPAGPQQQLTKPIKEYALFSETFRAEDRQNLMKNALERAQSARTMIETKKAQITSRRKEWAKTGYELYAKYNGALACFLFLFIGAPMGAIIRKGGFGYPILVSIIFFVFFIVLSITFRKFAENFVFTPLWAAMMPCILMAPIAVFLTRKAINDSSMFNTDRLERFLFKLRNRFNKQPATAPATTA